MLIHFYHFIQTVCILFIAILDNMEQTAPMDFPLDFPNEMIEKVLAYLSPEDLLTLAAAGSERLKQNTFSFLRRKSCELPQLLIEMSRKGDLDKIKQIFAYVNQENISVEEMGVKNNEINQGKKPTLVESRGDWFGKTPLIEAANGGCHRVCQYLLIEQKANVDAREDDQKTALVHAATLNHLEVIKELLKHNPNVKAKDELGLHAAYEAARYGDIDALKMLVEKDGDVIDLKAWNGETLLIAASGEGRTDVCKYLIEEKNANVNLKDNQGKTALQHAKNSKIIKMLKKKIAK